MMEDHQPVITWDQSVWGEFHAPVSSWDIGCEKGSEILSNNVEKDLNKTRKGRAESATSTERESLASEERHVPEKEIYPITEPTEYSPPDIKEEPASWDEENVRVCVTIQEKAISENTDRRKHPLLNIKEEPASCEGDPFTHNSMYSGHSAPSSEMGDFSYSPSDLVIQETPWKEEPFPSTSCGEDLTPDSVLTHRRVHNERPFSCAECGKRFTDVLSLTRHRRIHPGNKPLQCPEIEKCLDPEKLIRIVRELRPLWDMRDKKYHARDVQRILWERVANDMGAKVEDVKKRWRNLRDVFRREHKKSLAHMAGDGAVSDTSSWAFYHQMLFVVYARDTSQINDNVSPEKHDPQAADTAHVKEEEVTCEAQEEPSDLCIAQSQASPQSQLSSTHSEVSTPQSHQWSESGASDNPQRARPKLKRKRTERQSVEEELLQIEKEKLKILSERVNMKADSHYQFLLSLLPFLKRIPMHRQIAVRSKLLQVLIDEEEHVRRTSPSTSAPAVSPSSHQHHARPSRSTLEPIQYPDDPSSGATPSTEPGAN